LRNNFILLLSYKKGMKKAKKIYGWLGEVEKAKGKGKRDARDA